ncbi:MAG: glycosyltransferase [Clostridiales bacterium]|nr:glycosyltransferase [Clostridiales bacterium]
MKKISIIIAAYNAEAYIERCINSVLLQKGAELEIIAVNDGSTDNTYDILRKFGSKITLINKKNAGAAAARNDALRVCTGDYVMFLDSDDYLPDDIIKYYMDICEAYDPDIIRGNYRVVFDDRTAVPKKRIMNNEFIDKKQFKHDVYPHLIKDIMLNSCWANLIKREIIQAEFRSDMQTGEDMVFMMNIYTNAKNVYFTDRIVYNYYKNEMGLTGRGLKAWNKFICNCKISREILHKLKLWDMYNIVWMVRACIRPLAITFSKLRRLFGDAYEKD